MSNRVGATIPHKMVPLKKLWFLVLDNNQFELYKNTTTGKIILYSVKYLDSVVIRVTHNYSSIT